MRPDLVAVPTAPIIHALRAQLARVQVLGATAVGPLDQGVRDAALAVELDTQPEAAVSLLARAVQIFEAVRGAAVQAGLDTAAELADALGTRARATALAVVSTAHDAFATWWGFTPGSAAKTGLYVALGIGAALLGVGVLLALSPAGQAAIPILATGQAGAIQAAGQGYGAALAGLGGGAGRALALA